MANHRPHQWEWKGNKFDILDGQFITSIKSLADRSGTSTQNLRSAIKRFEKLGFLTNDSTKTGRLITVVNWGVYQSLNKEPNKGSNNDSTKTQQLTRKKERKEEDIPFREIVSYLNDRTGKAFRSGTRQTRRLINARWDEGHRHKDFQTVIDDRNQAWGNDAKMAQYLRPETLFGTKFESYLQSAESEAITQTFNQPDWID